MEKQVINSVQEHRQPGFPFFNQSKTFKIHVVQWLAFCDLLLSVLLRIGCVESNPGPQRLNCGSCIKYLWYKVKAQKRSRCFGVVCGWVHFDCSGLSSASDYDDATFTCTRCCRERIVSQALTINPSFQKAHKHYSDVSYSSTALGNAASLAKATGLPNSSVRKYLPAPHTQNSSKRGVTFLD